MLFFELSHLDYAYGNEIVLQNINLNYDNKDFLSIIGPNGAGKSTLIKLILGLLKSKHEIKFHALERKQIGYVPQHTLANPNFYPRVIEIVLMGLINKKIFGFYSKKDKEKAMQALQSVNMQDFWDKTIDSLSGGQRQRVFIARALASECKMLILDEPTASVDTKSAIQIFELLNSLHRDGMGILLVCHDINLVLAYSDKIAYLNKELFLHTNTKEKDKSVFLKHLYENHSHFCDVEMSLNSCFCDEKNCDNKILCTQEFQKRNSNKPQFLKENSSFKPSKAKHA
ncbi:metal ABC transporter ATP-binding protein [Campylobacter sp. VicNov18]|uniref:ABC transporter ATP-binding protein n=1 Tax=Campylobacter bilis TaxID=2691918 RepID=UPI00130DD6F1|nr:metal ABC transporter ATP-binding protein [Campylobacter bilis]MPV63006.1 ATP-binding cassette domain-containing protein [Campylobacter hepaticus]MBM0636505.1 ATP-binding cassette domain-containing protein [Campylobacter bilis]MCC8277216.1 metal ABC transporter ATP-binding protein [Campylobacter bilis]MCC8298959.1 metal ABC transporter ATP-binding protein [Campylobacter bilis]MCC8300125.1 metal ABC transporter ATP-binding protein [Campylobacter bilis]